jgi:hypothetical protein
MIFAQERARREVLHEFEQQVLTEYLPGKGRRLHRRRAHSVFRCLRAHRHPELPPTGGWGKVNNWLARLMQLENSDWRPPALWALKHYPNDPAFLDAFSPEA